MNATEYFLMKMFDFWFSHRYEYCHDEKSAVEAVNNLKAVQQFCNEWEDFQYRMYKDDLAELGIETPEKVQEKLKEAYLMYC